MKLTIVSDLHVDINRAPLPAMNGEILIVAGDTANNPEITKMQISELSWRFKHVIFIAGNHENYNNSQFGISIDDLDVILGSGLPKNVIFLKKGAHFDYEGYSFIGANSWYSFDYDRDHQLNEKYWKVCMNDYGAIGGWGTLNPPYPYDIAKEEAGLIRTSVDSATERGQIPIVITHTGPSRECIYAKPFDLGWTQSNSFYFNSNCEKILEECDIPLWIHGHSHHRQDKDIHDTRVVSNPRGYPGENPNWFPLEIEL